MTDVLRVLYAVLMVLSSAACICGNLLLLLVLLLNKELWSDTLGFTLSHSLSDLALGLSTMPFGAHNALFWPSGPPGEGLLCQGSGFLFLLLQVSSVHSLAWATVDKFTEICFALSYSRIWTGRRSLAVLVLVWLFCLVSASLPLLGFGSYSYSESRFLCCPKFIRSSSFVLLWTVAGVAAPILAVCCLYGYIVYVALKQAKRGTFMCNELHCFYVPAKNYLRSSIVMVATSGCLLLCWLPYISAVLYETFSGQQSPSATATFSTWLVLTGSALNPWITCMTQAYRVAAWRVVTRTLQKCRGTSLQSRSWTSDIHLNHRFSPTNSSTKTVSMDPHDHTDAPSSSVQTPLQCV
ncbi:histamine H2 receptor isoform X2 [Oryzias melastigma]|uniref:histamine H2 receptor isoform X2 n=1 Tax=Oryzias melastigma TaxID=30732 RepID=UPI00168D8EAA|nr:histamine H2 receptor isoform X2 [Oryzias melastigma]